MIRIHLTKTVFVLFIISSMQFITNAQSIGSLGLTDARSVSLGNTYTTSSYGLYGLGTNPAALYNLKNPNRKWELITLFPLPQVNINVGSNFLQANEFNYFFGESSVNREGKKIGRYLTNDDKQRLLDLFSNQATLFYDMNSTLFALLFKPNDKVGTFAFSIKDMTGSRITIPKDFFDLLLNGNTPGSEFSFSETKFQAAYLRKYSISYANSIKILPRLFDEFNFGFSLNIISGFFYMNLERMNSQFTTGENNSLRIKNDFLAYSSFSPNFGVKYDFDSTSNQKETSISLFPTPAGSGFGIDLGMSAKINDVWSVGLSFTDLGSIKWTEKVAQLSSTSEVIITNIADTNQTKDLDKKLLGDKENKIISEIKSSLPSAMHLGIAFRLDKLLKGKFPGQMLIVADYNQGFNQNLRNSVIPRFSLGAEWIPTNWVLEFRTGFSIGEIEGFNLAFGLGLDLGLIEFNFATNNIIGALKPNNAKNISVLLDSRWRF